MKNKWSKKTICLVLTALVLVAGLGVGSAMAYFTTYAMAKGSEAVVLKFGDTEIDEDVVAGQKQIVLKNTGDGACYVRLKALTGDKYKDSLVYSEPDNAGKWTPGADGYYYFSDIVVPKGTSTELEVKFAFPAEEEPTDFNVIIIQECTPVLYDENGNPYADWSVTADVTQSVYKEEGES